MSDRPEERPQGEPRPAVLLVDDEPRILSALKRSLRRKPWRILTAGSAEQALNILESEPVQVVVSDYMMNGMDGADFLADVRKRWPDVQRVMLTGQASFDAIERAINQSELYRFLSKPWSESQLAAVIGDCLEHLRLLRANRRYEEELARKNRELVEVNQELERKVDERTRALVHAEKMAALGRMSGGIAHEINNPLGGILAFAQLLLRDLPDDDQSREALDTIRHCAMRCKDIIDSLLSFSRKPAGEDQQELSLNQVIESALTIARLHPRAREVDVRLELSADLPAVRGRAGLLEQVVVNLVQNAFDASADGQEIVIRTGYHGPEVRLEVEDRGPGIPPEDLPRIFEPFYTTKPTGQGTGLGLFICYGIAQEHGGPWRPTTLPAGGRGSPSGFRPWPEPSAKECRS